MSAARITRTPIVLLTPRWTGPDNPGHPAGRIPVAPVGAEHAGMARRAELRDEDPIARHAGSFELIAHAGPAVKKPVTRTPGRPQRLHRRIVHERQRLGAKPSRQFCRCESRGGEAGANVFADLITAGA